MLGEKIISNSLLLLNEGFLKEGIDIPDSVVKELLSLYLPDYIMIEKCVYHNKQIKAKLIPRLIEYSFVKPDYYTAVQLLEIFSQLGYLLGGMMFLDDTIIEMPKSLFVKYVDSIRELKCIYLEMNMEFKNKITLNDVNFVSFGATSILCTNSRIIIEMYAKIGNSFFATSKLYSSFNISGDK